MWQVGCRRKALLQIIRHRFTDLRLSGARLDWSTDWSAAREWDPERINSRHIKKQQRTNSVELTSLLNIVWTPVFIHKNCPTRLRSIWGMCEKYRLLGLPSMYPQQRLRDVVVLDGDRSSQTPHSHACPPYYWPYDAWARPARSLPSALVIFILLFAFTCSSRLVGAMVIFSEFVNHRFHPRQVR